MEKAKEALKAIMSSRATDKTVVAEAIWRVLEKQPKKKKAGLLEYVLCNYGTFERDGTALENIGLGVQLWTLLDEKIGKEVDANLEQIVKSKVLTSEMCQTFLQFICAEKSPDRKIFILARLLHYDFMPLLSDKERKGAVTLTPEEWGNLKKNWIPKWISLSKSKSAILKLGIRWPRPCSINWSRLKPEKKKHF